MAKPDLQSMKCPMCGETMKYHPPSTQKGKDYFHTCYGCGCEIWPENLSVERQIRNEFSGGMQAKHKGGGGGRQGRQRKQRKPGDKFVPWYQRSLR